MMRRKDGTQIKPVRPPVIRRVVGWLTAIIALLLAVTLLVYVGGIFLSQYNANDKSSAPTVFLLSTDEQDQGQFELLQVGLKQAGFNTVNLNLPTDASQSSDTLQAAILQASSDTIWLAASGSAAAEVWQLACQLDGIDGLMLLAPQGLDQLKPADVASRSGEMPIVLFAGEDTASENWNIRDFYEQLTGEDTALFPAYQKNAFSPLQYASSDGQTWLHVYDGLVPGLSLLSIRALPDAVSWLSDWSAANSINSSADATQAAQLLIGLIFALLLVGLLLLAVPLGLNLALTGQKNEAEQDSFDKISGIVLWLPAAVLAAALGFMSSVLTGNAGWLLITTLLLPGCRGWMMLALRLTRRQPLSSFIAADQPDTGHKMSRWTGGILVLATLLAAILWIWLSFGTLQPVGWHWLLLPILIAVTLPAGLSGKTWQFLPFLVLPIGALIGLGWSGLVAGLLMLMVHVWSASLGRAMTGFSRLPLVGSLIQAIAWSMALLLPPIVQGLSL